MSLSKKTDARSVFSRPVRSLSFDELKQVAGGAALVGKGPRGPDNQGYDQKVIP